MTATVRRVSWSEHLRAMADRWDSFDAPHVTIIAPNRYGKSHLWATEGGLLTLLVDELVVIIDCKGDDPTLANLPAERVTEWPPAWKRKLIERRRRKAGLPPAWYRLEITEDTADRETNRQRVFDCLQSLRRTGHATVILDEVRGVTDKAPHGLNLAATLVTIWVRGGYRELCLVVLTQGAKWLPGEAYEQAHHLYLGRMMDKRARDRLQEIGGDTQRIDRIVLQLRRREFLYVGPIDDNGDRIMEVVRVGEPDHG